MSAIDLNIIEYSSLPIFFKKCEVYVVLAREHETTRAYSKVSLKITLLLVAFTCFRCRFNIYSVGTSEPRSRSPCC